MNRRSLCRNAIAGSFALRAWNSIEANSPGWSFVTGDDRISILRNAMPIAAYVTRHPKIRRPFFQDIFTPGGMRITRPVSPDPASESTDHDTMHPGIWLAFGDLNGCDYWRNKAEVRHVRFSKPVTVENGVLTFEVENHWLDHIGTEVKLREFARYRFTSIGPDVVLDWNSKILTDREAIRLGHQEEMGLGIRLTRPLTVKNGTGRIDCGNGGVDEKGTWGKHASWWAASVPAISKPGDSNLRRGIQILAKCDPGDRPFWGHTRDYGLIVANPSPRPGSGVDSITIPASMPLEFRFRIRLFDSADPAFAAWADDHPIRNA
ncbi:hypothetical protein GC170_16705 [bacterium]|nr:hypothetical protein [bacterium]